MNPAAEALRARMAAEGGAIAFEEFMRFALYDPAHGYYSRRVRTVGRTGDFSTAATLHQALADAVAAWTGAHRPEVEGVAGCWHLIELGGGSGVMAARVLASLGWWARWRVTYHVVEVSGGLRAAQRERLAKWRGRVMWHASLSEALAAAGGRALIFSNEFVDAFPCARWEYDGAGAWREIDVAWPEGAATPVEVSGRAILADEVALVGLDDEIATKCFPAGQRVEVFLSYRRWMHEQLAGWRGGRMLTIDYGDELHALYHRRPAGTLRAYCRQMRFDGSELYERIGQQDLTADVDFTALRQWGEELGLATVGCETQAVFLRRWLGVKAAAVASSDPRLAAVLDEEGAGGAFKVFEQLRQGA